jgi:glycine cleavage system H protein
MDPKTLKYATSHEWVAVDGDTATVGVSKFAADQLTDLILIDLDKAKPGTKVAAGQVLGQIESVKNVSDLYSPVAGEVVEVNPAISKDLELISKDPFGAGWIVKLKGVTVPSDLLDYDAYEKQIADEAH